jgi:DnaJ-domain-containing protein 1
MNLPGRLHRTTLGDVLGTLYRAGVSGVLELVEAQGARAGSSHRIYFAEGLVDGVETSLPAPRLGEVLSAQGVLAREALIELCRRLMRTTDERSGQILIRSQLASEEAVASGLRRQLRLRLEALFGIGEAEVRFHVRRPARDSSRSRPLTPPEFLHGRPRARGSGRRATLASASANAEAQKAYRVLELPLGALDAEVRSAFRRLARDVHPDRHPRASADERKALLQRFAELSAAYHTLTR